jgi:hypothetical protein
VIETREQYVRTRDALFHLEMALAAATRDRDRYGPHFADVASAEVEMILKLRAEMDAYIGLTAYLDEFGTPAEEPADEPAAAAT